MARGDKTAQYLEQNVDFIQRHLRNYCLSFAAALIFIETLQLTNIETLYKYILHRLYDYEFQCKSQVYSKDQIFIPTGFDSQTLISELCKDANPTQLFEDRIKRPQVQNVQSKQDVLCDDWQSLLNFQFKRKQGAQMNAPKTQLPEDAKNAQTRNFFEGLIDKNKKQSNAQGAGSSLNALKRGSVMPGKTDGVNGLEGMRSSQPSRNEALQALKEKQSKNSIGVKEEAKNEEEQSKK